jgi:hypothetical protein
MLCSLRLAASLAVATATGGCAVGSYGTMAAHVQHRETVTFLSVYSVGFHLRTREDDPGAHVGYSRRTYSLPADDSLSAGWHFLSVPSSRFGAIAQDLTTLGLELSFARPDRGLTLGYARQRLFARVALDDSVLIEYAGPDLRVVGFKTCQEAASCFVY